MSYNNNTNIVFRCPLSLKQKMRSIAESRDEHLSSFIRSACIEVVRRECPSAISQPITVTDFAVSEWGTSE